MCLGDGIDYPDPGTLDKQSCCFFRQTDRKVLFCCTNATDGGAARPRYPGFTGFQLPAAIFATQQYAKNVDLPFPDPVGNGAGEKPRGARWLFPPETVWNDGLPGRSLSSVASIASGRRRVDTALAIERRLLYGAVYIAY